MKNPVIVALDVDDLTPARRLVDKLQAHVGGFKIGPRLTLRAEPSFFKDLAQAGVFFFDHKFFDIPSTAVASVRAAAELGADWVTVHALGGPACLSELAVEEQNLRRANPRFRILAVTVLTSFSTKTLPPVWKAESIPSSVLELASSAFSTGLASVVCSPEEIQILKNRKPDCFLVVPGIRPAGSAPKDDQNRVATPERALALGASALVIGRPIISQADPVAATRAILETLQ